jgi:hypothetical protein
MPDGTPEKAPAEKIANAMLENLIIMNQHMLEASKRQEVLVGLLDELVDWFNVADKMFELIHEQRGKKLNAADLAQAWCEAADEIFSEEEDEPGEEDPRIVIGQD